ncbi:MAG: HDOD domain-containing protein [Peptostreptococcaceae bacterium]|nr:HDOD domain-containing protein [Peptostreptococcaceae bacterium]
MDVFVARQPIFNRDKEIVAYELLYRNSLKNFFDPSVSSSKATSILITNSHINIGMDNLVEDKYAFINFDSTLINNDIPSLLNKDSVVIEVLEDVKPDRVFLSNLLALKKQGYKLALDDFTLDYPYQNTIPLYDIIKVDFMLAGLDGAKKIMDKYKNGKRKFLAEKIETVSEFNTALDMGYDYFQGFFFSKPEIIQGKAATSINMQFLKLKEEINKNEVDFNNISKIIESDIGLSYKLLRLVNSFSLNSQVSSIRHALAILGVKEIEKWLNFIMISDFVADGADEVVRLSIIRSRFAELIAEHSNQPQMKYQASLVGLFSMIDVVMGKPFDKIFKEIPMSQHVKDAITNKPTSPLYDMFQVVLSYEKADWDTLDDYTSKLLLKPSEIPDLYFESVSWANKYVFTVDELEEEERRKNSQ